MSLPDGVTTLLEITGVDFSPYSSREMTATLSVEDGASDIVRTINGRAVDFAEGFDQFDKYLVTIKGKDMVPPAFDGLWPGDPITVNGISELSYKTAGGTPARTVFRTRNNSNFTFYAPSLDCLVVSWQTETDEYGATVSWTLQAIEK